MQSSSSKLLSRDKVVELKAIKIIKLLESQKSKFEPPMVQILVERFGHDPFIILISCILSLRTRDSVTTPICLALFSKFKTPQAFLALSDKQLQTLVHSVNYYKTKARNIKKICKILVEQFSGKVPNNLDQLLALPGVGQKTANLVLAQAFGIPAIYVDTHVHRLSNLLGIVHTKSPNDTQIALKKAIPKKYWIEWCQLLVMLGQNISKCSDSLLLKLGLK